MSEAAWKWAAKTSNLRKNEIHGEEEARLCLSDEFQLLDEEGQEICMQGALELDDARMQQYMCMYTHMYMSIAIDSYNIPDSTYIYTYTYSYGVCCVGFSHPCLCCLLYHHTLGKPPTYTYVC